MKEKDTLKQVLIKYDLTLPLTWMEKRKIMRAKRRTLASILAGSEGGRARISWSLAFYYMMRGMGLDVTATSGARAGFAAAMLSLVVITGSAFFLVQRNFYPQWLPGQVEIAQSFGDVVAGSGTAADESGRREISAGGSVSNGVAVATGDSSALLIKAGTESAVVLLHNSEAAGNREKETFRIDLKDGCLLAEVKSPFKGIYEVITPDSAVRVTGTVFSVAYKNGSTSVTVYRGSVNVTHLPSGTVHEGTEGSFIESGKGKSSRKLKAKEMELLQKFRSVVEGKDITVEESVLKELNGLYDEAIKERSAKKRLTLDEIRKKYGGIYDVILYSGKRYKGAVISRGSVTRIMTVTGVVAVPSNDIKSAIPE